MKKIIPSFFMFLFLIGLAVIVPGNYVFADDPASVAVTQPPAVGTKFISTEGKFKISFQGPPEMASQDVSTAVGSIKMHTFMEMKGIDGYILSYNDYPAEAISAADPKNILDGAKNGVVNQFQAKIVEEKPLTLGGHIGLMCKANSPTMYVVYYAYLVKNRLYQIMILKNGLFPTQQEIDAFHGSFELIS